LLLPSPTPLHLVAAASRHSIARNSSNGRRRAREEEAQESEATTDQGPDEPAGVLLQAAEKAAQEGP